jgi:hypothetical protein
MHPRAFFALALACFAACGEETGGVGSTTITISGEDAAISGFPVGNGSTALAFADGWSLQFNKILISLTGFSLKSTNDDAKLEARPVIADLHLGTPQLWKYDEVLAEKWDRVGYQYAPPPADVRKANEVDDADIERMSKAGYSLYVEATAQKDQRTVDLAWGFALTVDFTQCANGSNNANGFPIDEGQRSEAQVTVHLDHLFLDSFANPDAKLRFEAIAAVASGYGPLTLDALAQQDNLADLKDADGNPLELAYDPGSALSPEPKTLEDYVIAAAATTGHWNGDGHCMYTRK